MAKENYHDKGYKTLLSKKRHFIKFLRHFVKKDWVGLLDEDSLHLCDKGFVDSFFKELESDLIYSAKIKDNTVYFYVLTELQSTVDYTMPFRMLKYIFAILMRVFDDTPEEERGRADFRLPAVVPIVFYNGDAGWVVKRSFKEYLQGGSLFDNVIDFEYCLVDIKLLNKKYLLENHDAISAAIAVDKLRGDDFEPLFEVLMAIVNAKPDFDPDEYLDFMAWLKHTLVHRVGSEDEADKVIEIIKERDDEKMRTGIDILFDNVEAKGAAQYAINTAINLYNKGKTIQEITDLLDLTDELVEQLRERLETIKEAA